MAIEWETDGPGAGDAPVVPTPGRSRSRGRWFAAAAAALVALAGAGVLGYVVGDDDDGSVEVVAPATAPAETTPDRVDEPASTAESGADEPADTEVADVPAAERDDTTDAVATTAATVDDVDPAVEVPASIAPVEEPLDETATSDVVSGGQGWTTFGEQEVEFLVERTVGDVVLRVHRGQPWDQGLYDVEFGGWQPPGWCFESGQLRVAMSGGAATGTPVIDVGSVSYWSEPYQGRAVTWLVLGAADQNPHRVVVVQAATGTPVSVTFADGSTDATTADGGVALLVVPGSPERIEHADGQITWFEYRFRFTVDVGGETIGVGGAGGDAAVGDWSDPEFTASCSPPPPALPEPGEPPADPAAAEAEIRDTMTALYGGGENRDVADVLALLDDATGVEEARAQVSEGSFEEAASSAVPTIEELVFTSPTEATFRYRIDTDVTNLRDRYGRSVLIDGSWRITRDTLCQDLSLAGGDCGDWTFVDPYSWQAGEG